MTPHRISVLNGLSLALLGLALSACDTAPTQVDQHFGMAVRQAQAQQTQRAGMHQRMHPDTSAQMPHRSRGAMPMPMPMPMPMFAPVPDVLPVPLVPPVPRVPEGGVQ
jgi:hypothetical protein